MAIDGTKIIDSDLAHDIYHEFMDLYDANIDIVQIKSKMNIWREQFVDDYEFEIFITAYALALWETGNLTETILSETRQAVERGAGTKMWLDESGENDSKNRSRVLQDFLTKISTPKSKIRKRKKYKKIKNFLFQIDDIVIFQTQDNSYRAAILIDIFQYRGKCTHQFAATSYISPEKPTELGLKNHSVFMNKIGCLYDKETVKKIQPGVEKFWTLDNKFSASFLLGIAIQGIEHQDLIKFKEKFEVIGKAKIKQSFKQIGSYGYSNTFENFLEIFKDINDRQVRFFKHTAIKIKDLS